MCRARERPRTCTCVRETRDKCAGIALRVADDDVRCLQKCETLKCMHVCGLNDGAGIYKSARAERVLGEVSPGLWLDIDCICVRGGFVLRYLFACVFGKSLVLHAFISIEISPIHILN